MRWLPLALLLVTATPAYAAVSCAELTSSEGNDSTDASSYATNSVTLTAGRFYLFFITNRKGTTADEPAVTDWTQVSTGTFNSSFVNRITVLRHLPSSTSSGALTITFGGNTQLSAAWGIVECTGHDTSGTNGSGAVAATADSGAVSANDVTLTYNAFSGDDNRPVWGVGKNSTTTCTTTGWTEFGDGGATTPAGGFAYGWRDGTDDTTMVHSCGSTTNMRALGVEVKAATPGGTGVLGGGIGHGGVIN